MHILHTKTAAGIEARIHTGWFGKAGGFTIVVHIEQPTTGAFPVHYNYSEDTAISGEAQTDLDYYKEVLEQQFRIATPAGFWEAVDAERKGVNIARSVEWSYPVTPYFYKAGKP